MAISLIKNPVKGGSPPAFNNLKAKFFEVECIKIKIGERIKKYSHT